ncbi:manganese efflux pump MntP family protein [Sphingomonas sp. CJ20]
MTPVSLAVLAFSMSADACAAAVARGAARRPSIGQAVRAGLVFGAVETVTPIIGYGLGFLAAGLVAAVDHWIAFFLLAAVGGKMIWEAARRDPDAPAEEGSKARGLIGLVATAIGTSIDAAAVGVTLAFLGADILVIALAIGCATFAMATLGMLIGRAVGVRFGSAVELLGGVGLIAIGATILAEHTGFLG